MGADVPKMVFGVILPEALPSLVRGICITAITLVGYTAIAGAVGAGGLGDVAIRYGYHRYNTGVLMVTLVMLVIFVQAMQAAGDILARLIDKQK
jgi:D-methionine transport system permease protein